MPRRCPRSAAPTIDTTPEAIIRAIIVPEDGMLERQIAAGADCSVADAIGRTPLGMAACGDHDAVIRRLLAAGADQCVPSTDMGGFGAFHGMRPVHHAARRGSTAALTTLLRTPGVDVDIRDAHSNTPAHHATRCGLRVLSAAISLGCAWDAVGEDGATVADVAVAKIGPRTLAATVTLDRAMVSIAITDPSHLGPWRDAVACADGDQVALAIADVRMGAPVHIDRSARVRDRLAAVCCAHADRPWSMRLLAAMGAS